MYFSLLFFSIFTIFFTFGAPPGYEQINKRLTDVSERLNKLGLQLNKSVDQLLSKIDENSQNIIQLIKSHKSPETDNMNPSSSRSSSALLIIDVQNDFINGSLSLRDCPSKHHGEEVVPVINHLLETINFDVVVYSYDWHPTDHISFFDNLLRRSHLLVNDPTPLEDLHLYSTATFAIHGIPRMEQKLWPRHCVQNTFGAQTHPDLKLIDENNQDNITVINIYKGTKPDIDSYSAFWDNSKLSETTLNQQLKDNNIKQVFVVGLATDWCVYSTAIHAMEYGYKTFIVEDACRGVDKREIKRRLHDFTKKNGHRIQSNEVKDYTA